MPIKAGRKERQRGENSSEPCDKLVMPDWVSFGRDSLKVSGCMSSSECPVSQGNFRSKSRPSASNATTVVEGGGAGGVREAGGQWGWSQASWVTSI